MQVSTVWELFNQLDVEGKQQFLGKLVDSFEEETSTMVSSDLKAHIEARHSTSIASDAVHYSWSEAKNSVQQALANHRQDD